VSKESLTDPSYVGQLLTLTYPLVGNYGVPDSESSPPKEEGLPPVGFESRRVWPAALIISRQCPEGEHSHWRAHQSLGQWLRRENVPGLAGIDVRLLTKKIREKGTLRAKVLVDFGIFNVFLGIF
jgi:carbamoylphosphate synthase small subunit